MPYEKTIRKITEYARKLEGVDVNVLREGFEISRLHRELEQVIENDLAGWGLTARQIDILEILYHDADGTATPAELSDEVGLTRSAMTSALDSLEKLGYTFRAPHPSDRRMLNVALTPAGREFISARLPDRYKRIYYITSTLSSKQRLVMLESYKTILDALVSEIAKKRPGAQPKVQKL